jgi:hypothetical protein
MPFHYFGLEKPANNSSMISLLCFVAISNAFGTEPIAEDFKAGQKIFKQHKGIDRVTKDSRIVIGQWFNGANLQPVEEAIFVTPGLLSRWLGYHQANGKSKLEVQSAWTKCSAQFSEKTVVVIRLARLCTVDMIDGDVDNSAKPDALDTVNVEIREASQPWFPIGVKVVQDTQQRRPLEVLTETWDEVLAKFTAWPSKPTENDLYPEIRWGLNRRVTLIAQAPTIEPGGKCELKISEKDRTRIIKFKYPKS